MEFFEEIKQTLISPQTDALTKVLLSCYTRVNYETFSKLEPDDIKTKFEQLMELFLVCSGHENENVRMMSFRACAFFLIKCGSYYLPYIMEVFYKIAAKPVTNEKSSVILMSIFAYLAEQLPCHQISELISKANVVDLFTISDPLIIGYIPNIIKHLGQLPLTWHKNLLTKLVEKYGNEENMYYFQSVYEILNFYGKDLIDLIFDTIHNISLINFIFPVIGKYADTSKYINLSIEKLQEEKTSIGELDCALQLISSHVTQVSLQNETLKFTYNEKTLEITNPKILKCATLYKLPFPIDQLQLSENDSGKIIESKFISIGKLVKDDNQLLNHFIDFLSKPYSSDTTFVLQALAQTINDFSYSDNLAFLLQKLFFSKQANWYNTSDVLSVIYNVKDEMLIKLFGKNGLKSIIEKCCRYVCSRADGLINIATSVVVKIILANIEFYEEWTLFIAQQIDFTDDTNLVAQLYLLQAIIQKTKDHKLNHIQFVIEILMENCYLYHTNLDTLTSIFFFISNFPMAPVSRSILKYMFLEAIIVIVACYRYFSGNMWLPAIPLDKVTKRYELFTQYVNAETIDITAVPNVYTSFKPFDAAIKFIMNFSVHDFGQPFFFDLIDRIYPIFQSDVIKFIYREWPSMDPQSQIRMLQDIANIAWNSKEKDIYRMAVLFCEASKTQFVDNFSPSRAIVSPVIDSFLPFSKTMCDKHMAAIYLFKNREVDLVSDEIKQIADKIDANLNKKREKTYVEEMPIVFSPKENGLTKIIKDDLSDLEKETIQALVTRDSYALRICAAKKQPQFPFYVFEKAAKKYLQKPNITEFADEIAKSERPRKNDVLKLMNLMNDEEISFENAMNIFEKMISDVEEKNRLRTGLNFGYLFATTTTKAETTDLQKMFDSATSKYILDEVYYFNRLFCALISRGCTGTTQLSYTTFPGMIVFDEKVKIFGLQKGMPYNAVFPTRCFNEQLPSNYMCGLRLVCHAASFLTRSTAFGCLKDGFTASMKTLMRHKKVYCGGDLLCSAFSSMFDYTELSDAFVAKIPKLELTTYDPVFTDLAPCFPLLFASRLPGAHDYELICGLCNKFLFTPPSGKLFDAYISSLNARIDITSNPSIRDTIVTDPLLSAMRNFKDYECYWVSRLLFEWFRVIVRTSGIVQTLSMITIQFVRYVPRFSTIFVAAMMLLDQNWPNMTEEEVEQAQQMLNSAQVTLTCKAHTAAFILLGKRENRKLAIDLAFAPNDTEETDKISIPIIESIK